MQHDISSCTIAALYTGWCRSMPPPACTTKGITMTCLRTKLHVLHETSASLACPCL